MHRWEMFPIEASLTVNQLVSSLNKKLRSFLLWLSWFAGAAVRESFRLGASAMESCVSQVWSRTWR